MLSGGFGAITTFLSEYKSREALNALIRNSTTIPKVKQWTLILDNNCTCDSEKYFFVNTE